MRQEGFYDVTEQTMESVLPHECPSFPVHVLSCQSPDLRRGMLIWDCWAWGGERLCLLRGGLVIPLTCLPHFLCGRTHKAAAHPRNPNPSQECGLFSEADTEVSAMMGRVLSPQNACGVGISGKLWIPWNCFLGRGSSARFFVLVIQKGLWHRSLLALLWSFETEEC